MKLTAAEFNEKHPVGTPVIYYPVLPQIPEILPVVSKTRTPAWELGHGAPVVSIEGRTGGMLLTHVEVRQEGDPVPEPNVDAIAQADGFVAELDRITAAREESTSIRCPHCQHVQELDPGDMGEMGLITYHGDEGATLVECDSCEKDFWVLEAVARTYETAKSEELD